MGTTGKAKGKAKNIDNKIKARLEELKLREDSGSIDDKGLAELERLRSRTGDYE